MSTLLEPTIFIGPGERVVFCPLLFGASGYPLFSWEVTSKLDKFLWDSIGKAIPALIWETSICSSEFWKSTAFSASLSYSEREGKVPKGPPRGRPNPGSTTAKQKQLEKERGINRRFQILMVFSRGSSLSAGIYDFYKISAKWNIENGHLPSLSLRSSRHFYYIIPVPLACRQRAIGLFEKSLSTLEKTSIVCPSWPFPRLFLR